jgi:uncharacterized protein
MLGFDTVYKNNFSKNELLKIARAQSRCVLSKSPYFLKFPDITFYQIKSSDSYQQLEEVINHFHLQQPSFNPFSRCLYCNAILKKKKKQKWIFPFCHKQKSVLLSFGNALHAKKFTGKDHSMKE